MQFVVVDIKKFYSNIVKETLISQVWTAGELSTPFRI